eukprot:CAMPEP_0196728442 /NCGR_PEP_ID=MMETSP1091-20130531/9111_1 /TAXON_ID=302021 /ORGANISM="Rhodomonas sp., Strain CCMP768" /LENGTH=515 /DNA_ID=CAMNT_0042071181 /DNA_START=105 /DNA_END=1652 /DNA_ORIENTATION=+
MSTGVRRSVLSPRTNSHLYLRGGAEETKRVTFKRWASVHDGEKLFVSGDSAALGESAPENAVEMSLSADGKTWEVEVADVPIGARYKYIAAKPADIAGTNRPTANPNYRLQVHVPTGQEGPAVVMDNTEQLIRFEIQKSGQDVRVCGSGAPLGNWKLESALKLEKGDHNMWKGIAAVPSDQMNDFKYKYVCDGVFETGNNRISDAADVEPQEEQRGWVTTLKATWQGLLIRFLIFHPLANKSERMVITGGHPGLGDWNPGPDTFCKMGLGNERTLLTGVRGRCWETTFPATAEDVNDVSYRYVILNEETMTAVWESEPNRFLKCIPGGLSTAGELGKGYRQREFTVFDGNFVAKTLAFDWIPPNMYIGPYPQSRDDVQTMKEAGVTGVVNVQTEKDIRQRMVNMDAMRSAYNEAGIELCHVPIEDFHGADLTKRVRDAAHAVHYLSEKAKGEGKEPKVYIHCTAGMGRAPATACIYLVWKHGYGLDHARDHVKHHRPIVAPNYNAMKQAIANGLD